MHWLPPGRGHPRPACQAGAAWRQRLDAEGHHGTGCASSHRTHVRASATTTPTPRACSAPPSTDRNSPPAASPICRRHAPGRRISVTKVLLSGVFHALQYRKYGEVYLAVFIYWCNRLFERGGQLAYIVCNLVHGKSAHARNRQGGQCRYCLLIRI